MIEQIRLFNSDNLEALKSLPDNSVDSIVTDPPYGLGKEPDPLEMLKAWINDDHYEHKGKGGFMGAEITKEILFKLYIVDYLSISDIAKKLNTHRSKIRNLLKFYNLYENRLVELIKYSQISKDQMLKLYVAENKTVEYIINIYNIKSEKIFFKILKYLNIPKRSVADFRKRHIKDGINKENLEFLYINEEKSLQKIAEIFNCGKSTISRHLDKYNIPKRKGNSYDQLKKNPSEHKKYGKDWRTQRNIRLEVDNYQCQQCGDINNLEVHHWTPYRFSYDNSLDNLVTVCHECHVDKHKEYIREGWIQEAEEEMYG